MAERFGWRAAFFALAIPEAVVALLARVTIPEPIRGSFDPLAKSDVPTLPQIPRFIWTQRFLEHALAAATVVTYWGWGLLWWTPAFLMRSDRLAITQAGTDWETSPESPEPCEFSRAA